MQETKTETVGFRLSPQQQQLLTSAEVAGATQCAVLLDGPVDLAALRSALDELVARHEILRTTFLQPQGMRTPQQVIDEDGQAPLPLNERADAADLLDGGEALERLMAEEAALGFEIERGPLLRALIAGPAQDAAVLVLSACAACVDAASLLLAVGELCEAYSGVEGSLEPVQYADYAEWRHELIADEESQMQDGLAFWREDADERPAALRILFVDRAAPHGASLASARLDLADVPVSELQRAAVGSGVTVPVLLEAVWHVLLARVSGASELLLSSTLDGRAQPDLAQALGAYEQPGPTRSRIQEATTFAEVLDQVRRSRSLAVRWQDCADGEDLASLASQAAAGWSFHSIGALAAPARRLLALRAAPAASRLTLMLRGSDTELSGELAYDPLAVESEDARELAARFVRLLRSALADPSAPVSKLTIVEDSERERLVSESGSQSALEVGAPIHEQFELQAKSTPDSPAVAGAVESLTYAELDAAANRLANHLAGLGVARGDRVGLCMERTPSMLVALLAILKAGAAYVPLNHDHPQARVAHQLSEAGARILITEEHLLERLPSLELQAVCVDRDAAEIAACGSESLGSIAGPQDLVYVMYTSGSTGTPKGVGVTHANLAAYVAAFTQRLSEHEDPAGLTFGVVSAISTDLGNTSIFTPLASGGCIRLFSADAAMDGSSLAQELGGEPLDVLKIAPSHLRALLAAGASEVLPSRRLVIGGEALSWELVEQIQAIEPDCQILNHYGPTETTIGCATYPLRERRADALTVPIGFPLAGVRAYVLDRRLEPVPAGVPGELCIAGAGVASGYLGDAEGGFTADPFGTDAGERMYRTGDLVRRLRDGAIEFLGRLDDQVKIRGFRVEPGEVETVLATHPAIRQVAVCAEDDERGDLRLAAYLVAPEAPAVEELRAFLARSVPDHMIPSVFRTVEALPLTASGKIDRRALAGMAEVQARREAEYVAPRDPVEQAIAEIWEELLGVERVGAFDDFFALGGHSLLATQATMRIRRVYGEIPLRALLAAPTVAALAEVIRETGVPAADGGR